MFEFETERKIHLNFFILILLIIWRSEDLPPNDQQALALIPFYGNLY